MVFSLFVYSLPWNHWWTVYIVIFLWYYTWWNIPIRCPLKHQYPQLTKAIKLFHWRFFVFLWNLKLSTILFKWVGLGFPITQCTIKKILIVFGGPLTTCFVQVSEVQAVVFDNGLEICLCIVSIQDFDCTFRGIQCALWLMVRAVV